MLIIREKIHKYLETFDFNMKEQLTAPILVSNAALMVLQIIRRRGAVSRSTVTEITGWSKAKTTQEIRFLLEKEYLVEVGNGTSQGGRKPKMLKLNPDLGYLLGVGHWRDQCGHGIDGHWGRDLGAVCRTSGSS